MDHVAPGGVPSSTTSPTKTHPQKTLSSDATDLGNSAESSNYPLLARAVSTPATTTKRNITRRTKTHPEPREKGSLPFHPTAQPKEKLPQGISVPSLNRMFTGLLQAPRPVGDAPPVLVQIRNVVTYSWLNLLLVLIPVSWAAVSEFPADLPCCVQVAAISHHLPYSLRPILPVHPVGPAPFTQGHSPPK